MTAWRLGAAVWVTVAVSTACAGSTPTAGPSAHPIWPAAAPLSKDSPIPFGHPIAPPSEPREAPAGSLAFIVDAGSESVYEFDLARGRFVGPSPRVETVEGGTQKTVALPGYPTLVGPQPPQRAVLWGDHLFVAGGLNGSVIDIPVVATGLGPPHSIPLPPVNILFPDGSHGTDASAETGKPYVNMLAVDARGNVLAIVNPHHADTSVAYLLDPQLDLVAHRQLGFGSVVGLASDGSGFWAATSQGHLIGLQAPQLEVHQDWAIPRAATALVVMADDAVVSVGAGSGNLQSAALYEVGLSDGTSRLVSTAKTSVAGPVAVQEGDLWWALPDLGVVRLIPLRGATRDFQACRSISAVAVKGSELLATCVGARQLAVLSTTGGRTEVVAAGAFPDAVVFGP